MIITLEGVSGSGKTTIYNRLKAEGFLSNAAFIPEHTTAFLSVFPRDFQVISQSSKFLLERFIDNFFPFISRHSLYEIQHKYKDLFKEETYANWAGFVLHDIYWLNVEALQKKPSCKLIISDRCPISHIVYSGNSNLWKYYGLSIENEIKRYTKVLMLESFYSFNEKLKSDNPFRTNDGEFQRLLQKKLFDAIVPLGASYFSLDSDGLPVLSLRHPIHLKSMDDQYLAILTNIKSFLL